MSEVHIRLFNRATGELESEVVFEQWFMDFFYGTRLGLFITETVLKRPFLSEFFGKKRHTRQSTQTIATFIEEHAVNTDEILDPLDSFESFNAFFIRKLKPGSRPIAPDPKALISPADGRLLHFPIENEAVIPVKGASFSIPELLADSSLAERFHGGDCIIIRLAPADYHRFIYIDSGKHSGHRSIVGALHSVSPYAIWQGLKIFTENQRQLCVLDTELFGTVAHIDVGAMLIGRMVQEHPRESAFNRADEKGYFEFGGSTIVLLFEPGRIAIDQDIREYSARGIESVVKCGSQIGTQKES